LNGFAHRDDIAHGHVGLNVVHGSEDKSSVGRKGADESSYLILYLFRGAKRQQILRIQPSPPKDDILPYSRFSLRGSIPTAEICTGFKISNPDSINSGIRSYTAGIIIRICRDKFRETDNLREYYRSTIERLTSAAHGCADGLEIDPEGVLRGGGVYYADVPDLDGCNCPSRLA